MIALRHLRALWRALHPARPSVRHFASTADWLVARYPYRYGPGAGSAEAAR